MKLRNALVIFVTILAVVSATLHFIATTVLRRSASTEFFQTSIQQALERGETDLAGRLLAKGVYYASEPEKILNLPVGQPALHDYLKAMTAVRDGNYRDAEILFGRAASSGNPLLASRAKIRLEEMRYGTGLPHAERIPF